MKAKTFLLGCCFFIGSTLVCRADAPQCLGDRHYDGVACCPVVDPPPPPTGKCSDGSVCECGTKCPNGQDCLPCEGTTSTTTTTLPNICPPTACICVPNQPTVTVVAPCPSLTCPEVKFPNYVFCRVKHTRHNGVKKKCRTPKNPHSLWVPAFDSVDGAQVG